ncbi:fibronectin type III domain-containing protein [Limisalsivibrio acetivorans]|uniref:fibronectin type III domain-containing protein n=1 Tax=Limisalsivibrio acetivorans TaxID=1304888 RepID=UPI0003B60CD8|nr:fibronectin type III domain-containing protein [Limisalsivibrio acetivorans]
MIKYTKALIMVVLSLFLLTACGGSGGTSDSDNKAQSLSISLNFEQPEQRLIEELHILNFEVLPASPDLSPQTIDILSYFNEGKSSFTVEDLVDGEEYYFKVKGYDNEMVLVYIGSGKLTIQPGNNYLDLMVYANESEYKLPSPSIGSLREGETGEFMVYAECTDSIDKFYIYESSNTGTFIDGDDNEVQFNNGYSVPVSDFKKYHYQDFTPSDTLSIGDTFSARIHFTNTFGQKDMFDAEFSIGTIFSQYPEFITEFSTLDPGVETTFQWTLPENTGVNSFDTLYFEVINKTSGAREKKTIGVSDTSYTIPADQLSHSSTYRVRVTAASGDDLSNDSFMFTTTGEPVAPTAPQNVFASGGGSTIYISWDTVQDASTYNIYWSTSPGVTTSNGTKISGIVNHYYEHTGLESGTTYYYIVTAENAQGESPASSEASGSTLGSVPPVAPINVSAAGGHGEIGVFWDFVDNATSYNVYYSTSSGVSTETGTKVAGITNHYYYHTGLADGATYYYIVTAVNANGEGPASVEVSATTDDNFLPAVPANLSATGGDQQVNLSWDSVADATSYNVYWSISSGVTTTNGNQISSITDTMYTHSGLDAGTTYYYIVTAVNGNGEGMPSAEASASTTAVTPPAYPANFDVDSGDTDMQMSWDSVADADSYTIYWKEGTGVTDADNAITGITDTLYTHNGISNGPVYCYAIASVNAGVTGPLSAEQCNVAYPKTAMLSYYSFDGTDSNFIVNATPTTDQFGTANEAYSFDGSSEYIGFTNDHNIGAMGNELTIAFMIDPSSNGVIIDHANGSKTSYEAFLEPDNSIYFFIDDGTNHDYMFSTSKLTPGVWAHVAVVYTPGTMEVYINGALDNTKTVTLTGLASVTDGDTTLGSYMGTSSFMGGSLDSLMMYYTAVDAAGIQAIYNYTTLDK